MRPNTPFLTPGSVDLPGVYPPRSPVCQPGTGKLQEKHTVMEARVEEHWKNQRTPDQLLFAKAEMGYSDPGPSCFLGRKTSHVNYFGLCEFIL